MKNYTCPVCFSKMEDPPENYNICPTYMTEFGYNDFNATHAELREEWLKKKRGEGHERDCD